MKEGITRLFHSVWFNRLSGLFLGGCWVLFARSNLSAFFHTAIFAFFLFFISESLQALFFVIRKDPVTVSTELFDWAVAFGGTFAVLLLRPGGTVIWSGGNHLIEIGFALQIIALVSLNRSFAIVAAKREIKTGFGYAFVRHPIYASYVLSTLGYLLFNVSLLNIFCFAFFILFTVLRIQREEAHLSLDDSYRAYMARTRYRLLPLVY